MKNIYKIISLLIFNYVFFVFNCFSQTAPGIEWQKCLGGTNSDLAYSIQQTSDGGYVTAGFSNSNDGDVTGNHGSYDYWVVKLDGAGTIQWQKCLGGTGNDYAYSIQQTSDGGYVVAGYSDSNDGDVTGNHGDDDYWIVKLDTAGIIQWQKSLGGSDEEEALSIQQTADEGYVVAGKAVSNDGDVTGNHGGVDYWVVKLDTAGTIQWQKCLGGYDDDAPYSIQQTADGGYVVAGLSGSNSVNVTGNHGLSDSWVVKLDAAGNIQWQKCLGGTDYDRASFIQQTTDGGYVAACWTESNDGDVTGNHGSYDYWVVKLDTAGNIEWQKCLGGTNTEAAYSIQQTTGGNYVVAGASASNDGDVTGNHGTGDYWVVKLDGAGIIEWQKCMGGSGGENANSIQQTADGGYITAGFTQSNNGDVTGNHGNDDYWIVKLAPDTITGIPNLQSTIFNLQFSPNPLTTQSKLTFKNTNKEKFLFTLYDITGRVVETDNYPSLQVDEIILTKGSKPAGVYLFNLTNKKTGERWNGKIIITDLN